MRLLWIFCLWVSVSAAQGDIFIQEEGVELLKNLSATYKPNGLMSYGETRDTMYRNVYRNNNGEVTCYYTGHTIFLPDDVDPTTFLYNNSDLNGITAEHLYPQSKGAGEGDARSDMHSLVPAIWRTNEGRSNYPFGEVPDDETDHWYVLTDDLREIPTNDLDLYSEQLNGGFGHPGLFEPRESVKGDIARAIFYFYTMYKEEADNADPDFFNEMKDVLFIWHKEDPVDELERELNIAKARYQQNKLNPFILDCSLVRRAYFPDQVIDIDCSENITTSTDNNDTTEFIVYPNPVTDVLYLSHSNTNQSIHYSIDSIAGQSIISGKADVNSFIDLSSLLSGTYLLKIEDAFGNKVIKKIYKK